MSNFTDGKNYLAAGEYDLAAKKLEKALDAHPDDGRVWWALMLCKAECKTEAELEKKLVGAYAVAAEKGDNPPENPVYGAYGKNALRYAPSDKYNEFATALSRKLDEIWQRYRGKPLKAPREIKREEKPTRRKNASASSSNAAVIGFYCVVAAAAVCGALSCVGIGIELQPLLWTGFALFAACAIVSAGVIVATDRAGKKIRGGTAVALSVALATEIIMIAVALHEGDGKALIAGIVMLVLTAGVMAYALLPMRNKGKRGRDKDDDKEANIVEKAKGRMKDYNDNDD